MKANSVKQILTVSLLAGGLFSASVRADVEVLFAGGNASQTVLYAAVSNILTGVTAPVISPTNSTVRTYKGTIASQPGLGNVTIDFALLGAVGGLQDLAAQNNEFTATSNSLPPTVAVSSTSPEAVALNPSPFVQNRTLVVPFVFAKNANISPALAGVTNLTQRQAAYLEGAAGYLPASFFGGTGTNPVYLVARNTAAAVRTEGWGEGACRVDKGERGKALAAEARARKGGRPRRGDSGRVAGAV